MHCQGGPFPFLRTSRGLGEAAAAVPFGRLRGRYTQARRHLAGFSRPGPAEPLLVRLPALCQILAAIGMGRVVEVRQQMYKILSIPGC